MIVTIREAQPNELHLTRKIATITWPVAYSRILEPDQLEYMLGLFYSDESLADQYQNQQHRFFLAFDDNQQCVGFASYSYNGNEASQNIYKLHKLYVLPDWQKAGVGRQLLQEVITVVRQKENPYLIVNVNRHNSALHFYQKLGFQIIKEEDIDIGNGYYMIDYVMERKL